NYTTLIFDESDRERYEDAILNLSELTSDLPISDTQAVDYISDTFKLAKAEAKSTLQLGSNIGFFDTESISSTENLIFNGNLFRREDARKISAVLSTLNTVQTQNLAEVNLRLNEAGCLPLAAVTAIL
ncbi:hypothetical protein, partial [Pseudomonas viridiflava]|uniref:hypothetical protein n=1 Tax=Pseudomonas viridiflava TaxID=33069 RepID=UPI0019CF9A8A